MVQIFNPDDTKYESVQNTRISSYDVCYSDDVSQMARSVIEINSPNIEVFGMVNNFGLASPYMGSSGKGNKCAYCQQTGFSECYGHSGIISDIPMYISPGMIKMFVTMVNITCTQCGTMLLSKEMMEKFSMMICNDITDFYAILKTNINSKYSTCPKCKATSIKFKKHKESSATLILAPPHGDKMILSKDLKKLKNVLYHSPDWNDIFGDYFRLFLGQAMAEYLSVVPFPQRLYAFNAVNNVKQAPFIQFVYQDLLSNITKYRRLESSSSEELAEINKNIFISVTRIMIGDSKGMHKISHQNMMENNSSLLDVGEKKGFLRNNGLTKTLRRVGRLTVMCDNDLSPGYVGLPQSAALNLIIDCVVTNDNIEILSKIDRKTTNWPAIFQIISNGIVYSPGDILFATMRLSPGDHLKRSLLDDDILMVTRPPILKNTNQTTCRVIINKDTDVTDTGVTMNSTQLANGLSGDNDGDMLIMIPMMSAPALADMITMLNIESNSRTYKNGNFDFALMSNGMIGLLMATIYPYHMSLKSAINSYNTCQLSAIERLTMIEEFKKSKMTVVDFLNTFIPDYVYLRNKSIFAKINEDEPEFRIEGGKIVSGLFCSNASGGSVKTSIAECIYMTHGAAEAIHVMHRLRLASTAIMRYTGFGFSPMEGHIDDETIKMIRTTEAVRIRNIGSMINVLDSTPHSLSSTGGDIKTLRLISMLDPFKNTETIVSGMINGRKNRIFNLVMGSKRKTDDLTQLGGIDGLAIAGDRLLPHTKNNRIFCLNASMSNHPADFGYMQRGPFIGAGAKETQFQSIIGSKALCGRQFMTRKPGFISRFSRNALGGIYSDAYGNLVVGTPINNPHHIYSSAGIVNGKPDCVGSVHIEDWIDQTPKSIEDRFIMPANLGISLLFKLYKILYEDAITDLNATLELPGSHSTTEKMEILYSPHKNMRQIKKSKSIEGQCEVHYRHFIESLIYIATGYESYLDGEETKPSAKSHVRMLIIMMLISHPPYMVVKYDLADFDDFLQESYNRIVDSLLDPYIAVGCRAAMDITEDLTQKTLDAPKTAKGIAIELEMHKHYTLLKPNPENETSHCFIKNPLPTYDKFIYKTFRQLKPNVKVMKGLPARYIEAGYGKLDTYSDQSLYNIVCTINRSVVKSAGLNISVIIMRLTKDFEGLVILLNIDVQTVVILLQCHFGKSPTHIDMVEFINENIMNQPIGGIKGIHDIKLEEIKRQQVIDGEMIIVKTHFLTARSNCITSLLKIPGVEYDEIIYENPGTQKKYFGITSAMMSMMHFCAMMFPNQYHSNAFIYAAVATCSGEYTPINQYLINKLWPERVIQDAVLSKPREKFINSPQTTVNIPVDDIVSAMIMGSPPAIGSGAYTLIEDMQDDDKFVEIPYSKDVYL